MSRGVRIAGVAIGSLAVALLALAAFAWRPAIDPVAPSATVGADRDRVARGATLAAIGNCASCHSTANGMPYAGGVPLATPFGTIYGSNITPDARTGIGQWSEQAFARGMRDGVSRDGHLLYPAFPYDHFRGTTDGDLQALYAFLMTRDAAQVEPPANGLLLPLRWRPLIAGWNLLFLHDDRRAGPAAADPVAVQGTYLVDTLAHCGSCHTARNALSAEKKDAPLAGAVIDGWYAPPLNHHSPSPVVWTVDAMTAYLRTGLAADHAIAAGPMQTVVRSFEHADAADVAAIATAIVASMGPSNEARTSREAASLKRAEQPLVASAFDATDARLALGASVYATACADCHDRGRGESSNAALRMPLAVALYEEVPHSLLHLIREGVVPGDGAPGRWMPAFGSTLSDEQLVALLAYLRRVGADAPPWPELGDAVAASGRR